MTWSTVLDHLSAYADLSSTQPQFHTPLKGNPAMFDSATEVLTATGWLPIADLTTHHPIAQFNPDTGVCEGFLPPKSITFQSYTGTMLLLDGMVNVQVTPDHLLYASCSNSAYRRNHPVFELQQACHQLHGQYRGKQLMDVPFRMRKVSHGTVLTQMTFSPFNLLDPVAFARLVGFAISDGRATKKSHHKLIFRIKKQRKRQYLSEILSHPGICRQLTSGLTRSIQYTIRYPQLGLWLAEHIYLHGKHKTLPAIFFQTAPVIQEAVLDGLRNGDGYTKSDTCWEYATTSAHLADQIQALGVILGQDYTQKERAGCYRLYTPGYAQPHINDIRSHHNHVQTVPYHGNVYGIDTVFGVIAIRRHKQTLLIGGH